MKNRNLLIILSLLAQAFLANGAGVGIASGNAYFIPSPDFIDAVKDAVTRGVRVIILTNSPETNDLPELSMVGAVAIRKFWL